MSDHHKENKTLPLALLLAGIGCIMVLSCCFVWLVVRCERNRRRRKYRPKGGNRYSMNASHMANGQELTELPPRHLNPSANLIHYSGKNSQSIPSLLSVGDSMMDADSIASEPLYSGRNYDGDEDDVDYSHHRDLSIARILGSFPELPYYQPPSGGSSAENVSKKPRPVKRPNIPIPRPRASNLTKSNPSINPTAYYGLEYRSEDSLGRIREATSTRSVSSAESLKVDIPGGSIRARDMTDLFDFTKLRGKKSKIVTANAITIIGKGASAPISAPKCPNEDDDDAVPGSSGSNSESKDSKPTFETEV